MSSPNSDTDSIEKLYKNFGILADAKDKISEHTEEYLEILSAIKGSSKEKRLASQFIARFFKHFPSLSEQAIEAQLDLCEDEDVAIRKQAIKDLPALCRESKVYTHKIADILAQLLQTEDPTELSIVNISLIQLLKNDPRGALSGLFSQIDTGDDLVRERCIKFLTVKLRLLGRDVINKEVEDYLIAKCKKVLLDEVTGEEFQHLMEVLGWTRLSQSVTGQQELVDIVAVQAGIAQPFDISDPESEGVEKLIHCFRHALPYFSSQVDSARFVKYLTEQVFAKISEMTKDQQLELLKIFAELSTHCGILDDAPTVVESVFQRVIYFVPVPDTEMDVDVGQVEPGLEYSHIECLLYSYHRLLRQCPETISKDPEVLKDFRFRMQYLARGVQGYIKKLREALQGKTGDDLRTDENKLKAIALKTTTNINSLIKDLFHTPPIFKAIISLSWKPASAPTQHAQDAKINVVSPGSKRHTPITFGNGSSAAKVAKNDYNKSQREIYQPPSGKYSNKVSSYGNNPAMQRGRGGGGRFRGRGSRPSFRNSRGRGRRNF